jgi:hypothetical protein
MNFYLSATGTGVGTLASSLGNLGPPTGNAAKPVAALVKVGTGTWNITHPDVFRLSLPTNTTNGTTVVTVGDTAGFYVNMVLEGNPNIPPGSVITSIVDRTTFTISQTATGTANSVATYYGSSASNVTSVNVAAGTLGLLGAGTLTAGTGVVTVNPGATLSLDNSGVAANNVSNRLGLRPVTLAGGKLNFTGSSAAASTEQTGTFTFGAGNSVILQPK